MLPLGFVGVGIGIVALLGIDVFDTDTDPDVRQLFAAIFGTKI
jgi:hypothetical protein